MQVKNECVIPAETVPVEIELIGSNGKSIAPLKQDETGEKGINPCYIDNIKGIITRKTVDGADCYYFTRSEAGTEQVIVAGTDIITEGMINRREDILIIWIGQNGGYNSSAALAGVISSMINYLTYNDKQYIVLGSAHNSWTDEWLSNAFGEHFLPLHEYLLTNGLQDMDITPTEEDEEDIAAGIVPASLRQDSVHFNDTGYELIGKMVYNKMKQLGYCE